MRSLLHKPFLFFFAIAALFFSGCKSVVDDVISIQLKKEAEAENKQGARIISDGIRMDSASATGKSIRFNYTLIRVGKQDVNPIAFYQKVKPEMIEMVNTKGNMAFYRKNKIKISYAYYYKDGQPLSTITIKPEDYKEEPK